MAPLRHYATIWESIADAIPDSPALRHGPQVVTWRGFDERSARLAGALRAHGVGEGDVVASYLYNCPEFFEVFHGALKIRAVPTNINYRYRSEELLALLENSEAKAIVFDSALRAPVEAVAARAGELKLLVEVGAPASPPSAGVLAYEDLLARSTPAARLERAEDDSFLSYTGGTTGLPKGVVYDIGRSVGNSIRFGGVFIGEGTISSVVEGAVRRAEAGDPLSAIPASPLMHSTAFIFVSLPTLTAGGVVTTLEPRSFDAHALLDAVEQSRARVLGIVGDAFALPIVRALDGGRPGGGPYDVSSLRVIVSAGVGWSAHLKERMLDHLPDAALVDSCGTTEGVYYGLRTVRHGDSASTVNFDASPGLKVMTPGREELPVGEVGLLAGTTTAFGYHRDPERTETTFFDIGPQRYVIPGDLGRLEGDGTVTLIGRGFATINTGGEKVFPAEVEEAIRELESVDDCLVVGVPHERFGQAVGALVVVRPGRSVEADEVVDAVRAELAGYKVPRTVRFVERVPRLPNGKIDYDAALRAAQEQGASEPTGPPPATRSATDISQGPGERGPARRRAEPGANHDMGRDDRWTP